MRRVMVDQSIVWTDDGFVSFSNRKSPEKYQTHHSKQYNYNTRMVARERFELSSAGPKPAMLDHYTTGLRAPCFQANFLMNDF